MILTKRTASVALSVAVVGAGALTAWAILAGGTTTRGEEGDPTPGISMGTPVLVDDAQSIAAAREAITNVHVRATIASIDAGDDAALFARIQWETRNCSELFIDGSAVCESQGLIEGQPLELFRPLPNYRSYWLARADTAEMLAYYVRDRNPEIDLLGLRDDGAHLVVARIPETPGRMFPGGAPDSSSPVVALLLAIAPDGTIESFQTSNRGTPPLEWLRYDTHNEIHSYEVLGSSPEFREREQSNHDERNEAPDAHSDQQRAFLEEFQREGRDWTKLPVDEIPASGSLPASLDEILRDAEAVVVCRSRGSDLRAIEHGGSACDEDYLSRRLNRKGRLR